MSLKEREKVKSTAFSDFFMHASDKEKSQFFSKVIKETVAEQRAMIEKAKACN